MYLNILKRDLKRKKTMNVILLIFVILSAMFMASSVNNILAVTSGLDSFFDKADMADYYVLALDNDGKEIKESLDEADCKIITVKNSGCTLPESEVAHIFDSFYRGSNVG